MDKFLIKGPNTLNGTVKIGGAKKCCSPINDSMHYSSWKIHFE